MRMKKRAQSSLSRRLVLVLLSLLTLSSSTPAFATAPTTQPSLRTIDARGWHMRVPRDWESYDTWSFDSPFSVVLVTSPSVGPLAAPDPLVLDAGQRRADIRIVVSRLPRDGYASVEWGLSPSSCAACRPPEVRREVQAVALGGRWGVLADAERSDGSRTLVLVVENDCYRYVVTGDVGADVAGPGGELAKEILAGGYADRSGKVLGRCRG